MRITFPNQRPARVFSASQRLSDLFLNRAKELAESSSFDKLYICRLEEKLARLSVGGGAGIVQMRAGCQINSASSPQAIHSVFQIAQPSASAIAPSTLHITHRNSEKNWSDKVECGRCNG
jgi:hypothetical protein